MAQTTEVNDGYTENYGKVEFDINDLKNKLLSQVQPYMLSINKNRYIIHIIDITISGSYFFYYKLVIDNYGDYIYFRWNEGYHDNKSIFSNDRTKKYMIENIYGYGKTSSNILPDKFIDIIKAFSNKNDKELDIKIFSESLEKIQILAKDYNDILIKYKSLNQSKLKDYDKLLEQIKNDNDTHKNDIEKLNKEIIEKDISINSLKKDNELLIKDNKSMDNEIKHLRELVVTMNKFSKIF